MITVTKSAIIAGSLGLGAALGVIDDAEAQAPQKSAPATRTLNDIAKDLSLPVGGTAYYFNYATETAIRERCTTSGENKIECSTKIMAGRELIETDQTHIYELAADGTVNVEVRPGAYKPWSSTTSQVNFETAQQNAKQFEWNTRSPLAVVEEDHILQNFMRKTEKTGLNTLTVSSNIPVSEKRYFPISITYDLAAKTISLNTMSAITSGATLPAKTADRDFNKNDRYYYDQHATRVKDVEVAYALRP